MFQARLNEPERTAAEPCDFATAAKERAFPARDGISQNEETLPPQAGRGRPHTKLGRKREQVGTNEKNRREYGVD